MSRKASVSTAIRRVAQRRGTCASAVLAVPGRTCRRAIDLPCAPSPSSTKVSGPPARKRPVTTRLSPWKMSGKADGTMSSTRPTAGRPSAPSTDRTGRATAGPDNRRNNDTTFHSTSSRGSTKSRRGPAVLRQPG